MSLLLRAVTTGSGATAAQVVCKHRRKVTVLEHVSSAYTPDELTALLVVGGESLAAHRAAEQLELGPLTDEVTLP